jgi:hypothetical protein
VRSQFCRHEEAEVVLQPINQRQHVVDQGLLFGIKQNRERADDRETVLLGDSAPSRLVDQQSVRPKFLGERQRLRFALIE